MAKYKVVDQDSYEPGIPKDLDKKDIVDRDSYIDPQEQIGRMIDAGERLAEFRREEFGTMEGDAEEDPTRNIGYDIVEAQRDAERLNSIVAEAQKAEALKKAEEKQEAEKKAAENGTPV